MTGLTRNGALSTTRLRTVVDDDRSALQHPTEARAPRKKQHQLDEDALPVMQRLPKWKRVQETCCPLTVHGLTIGSILAKLTRVGAHASEMNM